MDYIDDVPDTTASPENNNTWPDYNEGETEAENIHEEKEEMVVEMQVPEADDEFKDEFSDDSSESSTEEGEIREASQEEEKSEPSLVTMSSPPKISRTSIRELPEEVSTE